MDLDFNGRQILVRDGKGRKDRVTLLPVRVVKPLGEHLHRARCQHAEDLRRGAGSVEVPGAIKRSSPRAPWEWGWQWVFPGTRLHRDPRRYPRG